MTSVRSTRRIKGGLERLIPHIAIPLVIIVIVLSLGGNGYLRHLATSAAIAYILTASFNLVFGYGGIFSLAQVALYGVGAYASVYAENHWGWSFWFAVPFAMAISTLLAVAIAWPTARLRSIFIAMVTLAFAVTLIEVFSKWTEVTGGAAGIYAIVSPTIGDVRLVGGRIEYLWLCAVVAWLVAELMLRLGRSPIGRKLAALRETPGVLPAVGVDAAKLRLLTIAVSSALAGLAGALYAHFQLTIAPEAFGLPRLIELLLATVIGGPGTFIGPVVGVLVLLGLDEVGIVLGGVQPYVYGAAVILLMTFGRKGVAGWLLAAWAFVRRSVPARRVKSDSPPVTISPYDPKFQATKSAAGAAGDIVLELAGVSVSFGGVHAVRDVSLQVGVGEVIGLLGPNGAGKTTLMNSITGEVTITSGSISLNGTSVVAKSAQDIRKAGIARTFQVPALVPDLSLVENVMLGGEVHAKAGFFSQLINTPGSRRNDEVQRERARAFLQEVGIESFADGLAEAQPYGVLRLAEIARSLMLDPEVILLDEPGAGLTESDLKELIAVLQQLKERGRSVVVIDHHVGFVATVSDRIIVMNQGEVLAEGAPAEVIADRRVIEAYLGEVEAV
ncbi:branched-chain amino acid ABC transporter ATP-binding protein/permease [Pseudarthrobacter sp. NIBRBAC000502772]|uniref:branched-chain amino acid ABC transporter ATP-binding protein/permease n=1 Tax=Pseudarthrobacter sp. NIBRBAC000502772 TaxID=2590775 RepID=UPI0011304A7C|nr:branched-chain amino acid ABC transporter ATP-binding protein/permease [Pseudarthrobacter sp. NIBRBAC000502772]QDG66704.1 branched-chain amino acid ABC transporter ATP-binding protein/permease [Pseudarthrobacter sp. NIBRBAC000502772]